MKRKANELHVFLLLDQVDLQDQQCKKAEAISPSEARSIWMRASDPSSIILQPSKSGPSHEVEDIQYSFSTGFESARMAAWCENKFLYVPGRCEPYSYIGEGGEGQAGQP